MAALLAHFIHHFISPAGSVAEPVPPIKERLRSRSCFLVGQSREQEPQPSFCPLKLRVLYLLSPLLLSYYIYIYCIYVYIYILRYFALALLP